MSEINELHFCFGEVVEQENGRTSRDFYRGDRPGHIFVGGKEPMLFLGLSPKFDGVTEFVILQSGISLSDDEQIIKSVNLIWGKLSEPEMIELAEWKL